MCRTTPVPHCIFSGETWTNGCLLVCWLVANRLGKIQDMLDSSELLPWSLAKLSHLGEVVGVTWRFAVAERSSQDLVEW